MTATNMGKIYKSEDSGQSWRRTADISIIVHTLAIHPTNPLIAYAGQDFTGVIKTEDGGVT